jgi:hypothetical protein
MNNKLLTISIPTYNRESYLGVCLQKLKQSFLKLSDYDRSLITIFISDNSDNNDSMILVHCGILDGIDFIYYKNENNIGSDQNLANCYTKPKSDYVMLIGDDDYVEDNFFDKVLPILKLEKYDIIFLKHYGLTNDKSESKTNQKEVRVVSFKDIVSLLNHRNIAITFISSMIFRRSRYSNEEVNDGVGTNLVQVNLAFNIINKSGHFIYTPNILVGATRNNTGGYDPINIFLTNFFDLLNKFNNLSLSSVQIFKLKRKMLLIFYSRNFAQYIRNNNKPLDNFQIQILDIHFNESLLYRLFYRKLFLVSSSFSFYKLSLSYIFFNLIYYPEKIHDYYFHLLEFRKSMFISLFNSKN